MRLTNRSRVKIQCGCAVFGKTQSGFGSLPRKHAPQKTNSITAHVRATGRMVVGSMVAYLADLADNDCEANHTRVGIALT